MHSMDLLLCHSVFAVFLISPHGPRFSNFLPIHVLAFLFLPFPLPLALWSIVLTTVPGGHGDHRCSRITSSRANASTLGRVQATRVECETLGAVYRAWRASLRHICDDKYTMANRQLKLSFLPGSDAFIPHYRLPELSGLARDLQLEAVGW